MAHPSSFSGRTPAQLAARLILALLAGLTLSACASNLIESVPKDNLWLAVDLAGTPPVDGSRVTMEIDRDGGRLIGGTGCNRYTASYSGTFEAPRIGIVGMTKRGCLSDDLVRQERRFAELLRNITRISTKGERELLVETDQGVMIFERTERVER